EQFLTMTNDEVKQWLWDKKMDSAESGESWNKMGGGSREEQLWSQLERIPEGTPRDHTLPPRVAQGPNYTPRKTQTPYRPTTPFSSNPRRPSDQSAGQCFKCNRLGCVKANLPKNPNRLQFIAPGLHQRSSGPGASQIPSERRETVSVGGKKVIAWRDTGAQVSAIHQSLVDPNLINPEVQVTIQPFKSNSFDLPTAKLPVQNKGWSGMWAFAVYDDYPIPMLLGEDFANHVKLARRVGMVTCSQAKQAFTPSSVSDPSTRAQSVFPETQPGLELELAEQPTPELLLALNPVLATPSTAPTPEVTTEPALAAANKPTQEAQPEPEPQSSAPAESSSQSTETAPSHTSLPEEPSPSPQSNEEVMSPASREQFQAKQEADGSLQGAWTAVRSNPPPLSSSNRFRFVVERGLLYKETLSGGHQEDWHPQRQLVVPTKYRVELKVCPFTAQGGDDAEWPEGVYYEGKSDGGVEEVNLSMTLGRLQRQQIKELCSSFALMFSATTGQTERAYHSIDTGNLVDSLLAGLGESAVTYLDDVAIFSDSWAEHLEHLQKVFKRIREAGLTVKAKKCQIGLNRVTYLGHQVGQGTINPLQAKVNAIQKWPVPKSKKQVQAFLGLAGYYRRFVPHYSQIATPLTDLTKKKQPNAVQGTEECQNAFNQLKATLMSDPVLRAPDFDKPFLVTTDASERGVGAILMHEGPDQEFHPVVFLSKKLSERESHWSISKKECYAIAYALEKLRPYIWGQHFHLQTDHAALKWLHTVKDNNKKLLWWSLALQDFNFEIQHISGTSN
ncbi:unnamed protein product, partial [Natator depressus]